MKKLSISYTLSICLFLVTISRVNAQNCQLICKDTVLLALDGNCQATLNTDQVLKVPTNCSGQISMKISDEFGISIDSVFNDSQIGKIFKVNLNAQNGQSAGCSSILDVIDTLGPKLDCPDLYSDCISVSLVTDNVFQVPLAIDNCGMVSGLSHADTISEFDCDQTGFTFFFSPEKWAVSSTCGGQDNAFFSLSKDTLRINDWNNSGTGGINCETSIRIEIPYTSSLQFKWASDSLAFTSGDSFGIRINKVFTRLDSPDQFSGFWKTDTLKKGSIFEFVMFSDGAGQSSGSSVFDFTVISDIRTIINRKWMAVDAYSNFSTCTQSIFILKNHLNEVIFPSDLTDSLKTNDVCGGNYAPELTGWPLIKTGKYTTSAGIMSLKPGINACLTSFYLDTLHQICEGSFELDRTWIIIDYCSDDTLIGIQKIKVLDLASPVVSFQKSIIIPAKSDSCYADVILPVISAFDYCSPTISVNVETSYGKTGFGPHKQIAVGTYKVYYTATDGCGNKATAVSELEIKDVSPPVVACNPGLQIKLDSNGKAQISASMINAGASDNCCIPEIKIKRKTDPLIKFASNLVLSCNDLPDLTLTLSATDCHGNVAYCESSIIVKDDFAPVITCPKDITVSCENDLKDLDQYGTPIVNDNCSVNVMYAQFNGLDNCNSGTIVRTWQVSDLSNNTSKCEQHLKVQNQYNWNQNGDQIKWPLDYSTKDCKTPTELEPSKLPAQYSQPVIKNASKCTNLDVSYKDFQLGNPGQGCSKINRIWTIIEKCAFDASNGVSGKLNHTQTLEILDNIAPVLNVPADVTVYITDNTCSKYVEFPLISADDCDPNPKLSNNKTNLPNSISAFYPVGVNKVEIEATDNCGNSITKFVLVTVLDGVPPQVFCKQNVKFNLINLDTNGEMEINPNLISNGFSDNCTPDFLLNSIVYPSKISCKNIGLLSATLQITDMSGNMATCQSTIEITDAGGICAQPVYSIAGKILTYTGKPIGLVEVKADVTGSLQQQTSNDGNFLFKNLPKGGNFEISPSKELLPLNGVTTYDLLLLNEHILGKKQLDSPYKYIAADVNGNNYVTTADYVIIKDLLLLNTNNFPNGNSWRFIPENFQFSNYHPKIPDFPEEIQITNLQTDINNANFIGVKLGDLNSSSDPSKVIENEKRSDDIVFLNIGTTQSGISGNIEIPVVIQSENDIQGLQFELKLADNQQKIPVVKLPASSKCTPDDFHLIHDQFQSLMFSWINAGGQNLVSGDTLFKLCYFGDSKINETDFRIAENRLSPEAYGHDMLISRIELKSENFQLTAVDNFEFKAFPNPANEKLYVSLLTGREEEMNINLYNLNGQIVTTKKLNVQKGSNMIVFDEISVLNPGVYFLFMQDESGNQKYKKISVSSH